MSTGAAIETAELGVVTVGALVTSEGAFRFVYDGHIANENRGILIEMRNVVGAHEDIRYRVSKELQVLTALKQNPHAHLMRVHFLQTTQLGSFIAYGTELPTGNLSTLDPMPAQTARNYVRQICAGLDHIHTALGFLHRDVMRENVITFEDGRVELTNFQHATRPAESTRTVTGHIECMAPEIMQGQEQTKAIDYWALGILVCELYDPAVEGSNRPRFLAERKN